ncbi:TATA box-binding protein-associated factor RNA polymerase I subunit A isoform X2 [Conger conger]|uniref:TATA box-binding protein-associated factor RNA polymerase I subunit A isoform X2 n=1 Tax=Conger conger TaxID=82655 RepID=UPI002A5ABFF7|nr:TATA box-binding protein-associated factor RNA polymerase I subunit A isoform X2 [Conger conger]
MDDIDAELGLGETHRGDLWDDDLEREERVARPALPVKVPWDKETRLETGFHRSARLCLRRIQGLMLQQRWQEAAQYMSSYTQTLEDTSITSITSTTSTSSQLQASEIIWKLGTGILQQHPNAKPEDFNCFYERMKHIGVKNYLKICLEHSFHLLANGQLEDAKRQLSVAESWRYGKISASQSQTIRLIQAYRAFLDYFIWQEKKSAISGGDDSDMLANQEMHVYFRQASVTLKELLTEPGVWDPFIISYVNMLEFYGDQEGALSVLKEYAYDSRFPSNPNAHVYLYQHLRKHLAPNRKLISVLQILHSLLPCHELMLELCDLLLQTEEESLQEALTVIFSLLDYSGWKSSLEAWSGLRDVLRQLKRMKLRRLSAVEWGNRAPWWPAYHFSTYHARRDLELRPALAEVKSSVAAALMGSDCSYCRKRKNLLAEDRAKKHKALLMKPRKRKH